MCDNMKSTHFILFLQQNFSKNTIKTAKTFFFAIYHQLQNTNDTQRGHLALFGKPCSMLFLAKEGFLFSII